MKIEHRFDCDSKEVTYFALTYPFSYADSQNLLDKYEKLYANHPKIYFHRELLVTSLEGRRVDLVTITSRENATRDSEDRIPNLFPEGRPRPLRFRKPTVFVAARVHPGETQGSHMMNGLLSFLLSEYVSIVSVSFTKYQKASNNALIASAVLSKFVFKIVPMLNPDGVYKGFFRLDSLGQNLNRYYKSPSLVHIREQS